MSIKSNSRKGMKTGAETMIREVRVLTFRPPRHAIALATAGHRKVKKKFLCDLRVSSDLSGRSSQSEA